jgi:protein O-mannosyl-transferase
MGKKNKKNIHRPAALKQGPSSQRKPKSSSVLPLLIALIAVTFICFFPMLKNGFTNWDDQFYVLHNAMLRGPDWKAIFTEPVAANYHPLTMISLAINFQLSGLDPFSYLAVNLLFHLLNTGLVFYFIYLISGRRATIAFFTAVVFGIHPMHVESVAWISERKDVLYCFFFLLSLIKYWRYLETGKRLHYVFCVLFFILSLVSKPAAVILPLVLFLLDYWKGRPVTLRNSVDKIIFFVLAVIFAIITLTIQTSVAAADLHTFPAWSRPFFASYGIMIYFARFFVPHPLSSFHPFPPIDDLGMSVYLSPLFVLALLGLLYWQRKNKIVVFGILFYIFNLLLVLQIISVGLTIVSERYTYVPYIGLSFMFVTLLSRFKNIFAKWFSWLIPGALILIMGFICFKQTGVWKNSATLWSNVIEHYPKSPYARTNRAIDVFSMSQSTTDKQKKDSMIEQVLEDCNVAVKEDPRHLPGYQNRINVFLTLNRNKEALADANTLIQYNPASSAGYLAKGIVYSRLSEADSAFASLTKCLELNPNSDVALNLRATLLVNNYQKFPEALADLNKAIGLNPNREYFLSRSICYYRLGDMQHAKLDAQTALQKGATVPDSFRKLLNL